MENQVSPQPTYGVLWFTARTEVDKESRMVTLEDLTISKTDFPTTPDGGAPYAAVLAAGAVKPAVDDRAGSAAGRARAGAGGEARTDRRGQQRPPQIIVSQEPALLIRIDGQPVLRQVAGTGLLRVINTRVLLPRDGVGGPLLTNGVSFLQTTQGV